MIQQAQQLFQDIFPYLNAIQTTPNTGHENSLLTSFTASFLTILVCEIGDKTFFLAMIMAMKFNKLVVFIGSFGALAVMTVISAIFGKVLFSLIPKFYTNLIVSLLFFYFGFKLIYEAYHQEDQQGENQELKQVEQQIKEMQERLIRKSQQKIEIQMSDKMTPMPKTTKKHTIANTMILTQAFIMTFLAEWGDRSQIATIALAASYNLFMVNVGALLGHFICTGAAVQLGEYISKRVSQKQVHYAGGIVFILSGLVTLYMMFNEEQGVQVA